LSPVQLVGDESSDVAVTEFLLAGRALARAYGLDLEFNRVLRPSSKVSTLALGVAQKDSIPYQFNLKLLSDVPQIWTEDDRFKIRDYFIRAGHHASQIICRNYLSGLRDRNEYFEFLQQELKVAANLTAMLLTITSTAEKTKDIFTQVVGAANLGADAYQTFKFLAPEIETILPLVEAAQVAMRDYYVEGAGKPATFAGALNAVSKIEYQCTRSGIRSILTKTLVQGKPQFEVRNGTLYSTQAQAKETLPPEKPVTTKGK
jgi:hypothetical protein